MSRSTPGAGFQLLHALGVEPCLARILDVLRALEHLVEVRRSWPFALKRSTCTINALMVGESSMTYHSGEWRPCRRPVRLAFDHDGGKPGGSEPLAMM